MPMRYSVYTDEYLAFIASSGVGFASRSALKPL